ncbi:peptidoglycan-binding domain-containing protein [Streptomyces bohaiensis]|uniref:Peptidoglycan-binding protein n=1 Tax=Streptomyces bohaiensis TaxID=1431344 RepID=A0ABX1C7N4_9ACTN|nr:peptidoglycan-binding domain-containing protein [Streptomyces bohaiensis]NJQ15181.1 peptidoglycan-binding protein [Streptomyces bohaiensis]
MRTYRITRTLACLTIATAITVGGSATAGAATAQPAERTVTASDTVVPFTVNNLGLSATEARKLQRWLRGWGYTGSLDGQLGTNSWKAMQRWLKSEWGYTDAIDGIVGPNTIKALQRRLRDGGSGYRGPIDGIAGPDTRAAFNRFVEALHV